MFTEARKLHLIEDVLKLQSEEALVEIERILKSVTPEKPKRPSAREFVGIISKEDIALMEKAIEEGCEQVNPDDWK
jgi:hypothetical protein